MNECTYEQIHLTCSKLEARQKSLGELKSGAHIIRSTLKQYKLDYTKP